MTLWAIAFIASTALAAAGFVVVAVLWLKKLRETLALALGETAGQQIRTAQRLRESLDSLERQQQLTDQNIQALINANFRIKQDITTLAGRIETTERDQQTLPAPRVLH